MALSFLAIIFLFNWPWYIMDVDDPYTIAYHFFGRNSIIQPPYEAYDSLSDWCLSFMPRNYYSLYYTMVIWTFFSALIVYVLVIEIAKNFKSNVDAYFFGFILLLAMPEFNYLILSFKTALIGCVFIFSSHYILLKSFKRNSGITLSSLFLSSILFGIGAACRWNLIVYGLAIFADIAYLQYIKNKWNGIGKSMIWAIAANLFFLLFLYISGYSINGLLQTVTWANKYLAENKYSFFYNAAVSLGMLTPISVACLSIGFIIIVRQYGNYMRLWLLLITSILPYIFLGFGFNLKYLLTLLPGLFILFMIGCNYLYHTVGIRFKILRTTFWLLLLLPWFIGIWIYSDSTLWGPGFDMKRQATHSMYLNKLLNKPFSVDSVKLKLDAGFAISAPEGTRPFWGHFYALFYNKMTRFDKKMVLEGDSVIELAANEHMEIYANYDRKFPWMLLNSLCKYNYSTTDSGEQKGIYTTRSFHHFNNEVIIKVFNDDKNVENFDDVKKLIHTKKFIAYFTFSSLLIDFMNKAPGHGIQVVRQTGSFSCIFEIK